MVLLEGKHWARARRASSRRSRLRWVGSLLVAAVVVATVVAVPVPPEAGAAVPADAARFVALAPRRLLDTRLPDSLIPGSFAEGEQRTFPVAGRVGVPATDVVAVALTVVMVNSPRSGYATLFPGGADRPLASNVNVSGVGATRANTAIVRLGTSGTVSVFVEPGGDLAIDVTGYWVRAQSATAGRYVGIVPARALDTRLTVGRRPANTTTQIPRSAFTTVPATASAVALTVTATDTTTDGYVTVWPAGQPVPLASTLNAGIPGETVPNLAIVPITSTAGVQVRNQLAANVVVDAVGYFTGASDADSTTGLFVPLAPARVVDTRELQGGPRLTRGWHADLQVGGLGGVPTSGVGSVAANVTMSQATSAGYALTWPAGSPQPLASNANFLRERNVAAATLVTLGRTSGQASIFASGSTDVVVDVSGYFVGTPLVDQTLAAPRRCDSMMAFIRRNPATGGGSVVIRDLAGAQADVTVKTDVVVDAVRVAPNCDYLVLLSASPGVEDRYDISIAYDFIRDAATGVKRVSLAQGLPYIGMEVTDDSRYVIFYFTSSIVLGSFVADYLAAADVTTLQLVRGGYMTSRGGLSWVSETIGPSNLLNAYYTDTAVWSNDCDRAAGCFWSRSDAFRSARGRINSRDVYSEAHEGSDTTVLVSARGEASAFTPGMYRPRFTYNGDLTLSNSTPELRGIWLYEGIWEGATTPALRGRKILDNVNDAGQAFSRRWRLGPVAMPFNSSLPPPLPVQVAAGVSAPLGLQAAADEGCAGPVDAWSIAQARRCR